MDTMQHSFLLSFFIVPSLALCSISLAFPPVFPQSRYPLPLTYADQTSKMPTESLYPPIDIPNTDVWGLMFERKNKGYEDDHGE